jgi:hypothetical protein
VFLDYFSLEEINAMISKFKFSEVDKSNKPARVAEVVRKCKVHQSAAQTRCFARFLPVFVGHKIPLHDEKWESFLLLRDIL